MTKEKRFLSSVTKAFAEKHGSGELKISGEHAGYQWLDLAKIDPADYFTSGILEGVRMYTEKQPFIWNRISKKPQGQKP